MRKITSRFPGLKVLIVEDYFINQEVTKDILELMQCDVEIAENGKQALEMYQNGQFDLILMDIQMPDMDGLEITKKIRSMGYAGKPKPIIIALTASVLSDSRVLCLEAGMEDYIAKPMEAEKIEDMLRKYFSSRMVHA